MGFHDAHAGAAAVTFLTLYLIFTGLSIFVIYRKGLKTSYTFLLVFGLLRVGAQISATAFSVLGIETISGVNFLIAYLVLGAEGYFSLLLVSLYFCFYAETDVYGKSQFRPTDEQVRERSGGSQFKAMMIKLNSFSGIYHSLLVPANVIIIVGGTQLVGVDIEDTEEYESKSNEAKIMRGVGQCIFLAMNLVVGLVAVYLFFKRNVKQFKVVAVMMAWPFLFARGVFGVLSVFIDELNYFDISNYSGSSLKPQFLAAEYCLGATMEFIGASLILSTYFIKNDNKYKEKKIDIDSESNVGNKA